MSGKKMVGNTLAEILKAKGFVADNEEMSAIVKAKAEEAENLRLMQEAVDTLIDNGSRCRPVYSRK